MRLGVYGGAFDPPHLGHLTAASDACDALGLDRLLWIPSAVHPLKPVRTAPELRLEMVRAAIQGDPRFAADDLELRRTGPSYTVDTLRALRQREPGAALFFVTGADNLADLPRWREPDQIARLATLAVMSRAGDQLSADPAFPAVPVPVTRVDLSSTEVRRRVAAGLSIRYLVPEAVREVIARERLYGGHSR
ncbi:MAG TPA: nicotinate-nucleotide adenylyltransferase [Longimicrobium sp.]|uniref:nicotinate-nucleotide adenylyltransferase n=1 Tax=Longimicrobium sp. TaxID=2029185 RepID=UPI002EDAFFD5